jgi:chitin disaccharide deacetylase
MKATVLTRAVVIVADDYGIGPETSRGILDLACEGRLSASVLIVNAPDAERAALAWCRARPPADLGWHPNLTLDRPLLPPDRVPSLVGSDGAFLPLGTFLWRICLGRIRANEVRLEWIAQYRRFVDLVGGPPVLVNSHQHVSLFPPCDQALFDVLAEFRIKPYLRRVVEPIETFARVPGARVKRASLTALGLRAARRAASRGFVGCDWLAGVTDPKHVADKRFWVRWLAHLGRTGSAELCCHPGYEDTSLVGRDCDAGAGILRRPREMELLRAQALWEGLEHASLTPTLPAKFLRM